MKEEVKSLPGRREDACPWSTEMMRYCQGLCKVSNGVTKDDCE
jgi:hypothetical protein